MKKIFLLALLIRLYFAFGSYHPDLGNHLDWGNRFWEYGPKNFYQASVWSVSWPNQPPGTIYLWAFLSKINEFVYKLTWKLNLSLPLFPSGLIPFMELHFHPFLVKLPSILADLGIGWLIYQILLTFEIKEKKAKAAALLFWFNPIIIYNSSVWGQTDSLVNFLALLSLFLLFRKSFFWGSLSFLFSLYIKFSLIIFVPLFFLLFLKEKTKPVRIAGYLIICLVLLSIINLPFADNPLIWLKDLYVTRILGGQGNMLTANAFNLWAIIFGIDFTRKDTGTWLGLSYNYWGIIAFGVTYLLVIYQLIKKKITNYYLVSAFSLVSFFSFLFLTNMHERYLYPAFPFLALLVGFETVPVSLFWVVSIIHFLNLYHLWYYPRWDAVVNLLEANNGFTTRIFSLILLFLAFYFFIRYYKNNDKRTN